MFRNLARRDLGALLPIGQRGWLLRRPGFTATEVRALLRAEGAGERAAAVRRCQARPGDWLNPPPTGLECPARYRAHLPQLVFWYSRGESLHRISARLHHEETLPAVDYALDVACARIAACLNRDPDGYGLSR
jgi:hypothetical protein